MGSAGHAFVAHTKGLSPAPQSKDGGYGSPPHPLAPRAGQRYTPRRGRRRRPFVLRRVNGDFAFGTRLDGRREQMRVDVRKLLETRDDGQGRHYQFQGFAPRKYSTLACVREVADDVVILSVPEWHPRRPVTIFAQLVPPEARRPQAWLALRCDLSAPTAARLQPSDLEPHDEPAPGTVHPPGVRLTVRSECRQRLTS